MITKICINGFRHFKDFELTLEPQATLLCGLNGTGKTTVLELISRLQKFLVGDFGADEFLPRRDLPPWELGDKKAIFCDMGIQISSEAGEYIYAAGWGYSCKSNIAIVGVEELRLNETILFSTKGSEEDGSFAKNAHALLDNGTTQSYPIDFVFTGLKVASRLNKNIKHFLDIIRNNILALSINPFGINSEFEDSAAALNFDGSNFGAWYDYLLGKELVAVSKTCSELAVFIPGFKQFSIETSGRSHRLIADIHHSDTGSFHLPFDSLSHGQKILCILHIALRVAPKGATIMVDEFESYLSPAELQPLYDLAQDVYEERQIRFVFVSHHEKTLNWFQDCAQIMYIPKGEAAVQIRRHVAEDGISINDMLEMESRK